MTDICIDCDGLGKYPSGAECKSCGGCGRVLRGDGIPHEPRGIEIICDSFATLPTTDAVLAEREACAQVAGKPCEYCGNGVRTGLPNNACENCMNSGLHWHEGREIAAAIRARRSKP